LGKFYYFAEKTISMSILKIPHLKELSSENPTFTAARLVASGAAIAIDKINWSDFSYLIDVKAYLGYTEQYLWLHYNVKNELVKAVYKDDQDPVWQDSCVEFFIKQGEIYRNFEFNSLGVCLSAYGADRHGRKSLEKEKMLQILRFPSLNKKTLPAEGTVSNWSLTVAIPLELTGLKPGTECKANFYKCGDETAIPHYISWSEIGTATPDFHQPDYFGLVQLE
jgi:hypothetical protein